MTKRPITLEQLDQFSVEDETNQLYWRNKEVVTVVSLPWWVNLSAIAVGLGTAAVAAVEVARVIVHGI